MLPNLWTQNATITLKDNGGNSYQWQISTTISWSDIVNNSVYSGAQLDTIIDIESQMQWMIIDTVLN
jgi:hypothetical protein